MTERDLDIIETLTCRVRVMTLSQIATLWWEGDAILASEALNQLVATGSIERTETYSQYEMTSECLFRWIPSDAKPAFDEIIDTHYARQRSQKVAGEIYTATRFAANLFASEFTTFPSPEERPEQIRMAEAYVAHRSSRSTEASFWFNCRAGEPDASNQTKPEVLIVDAEASPTRAVSLLSRSVQRFQATHRYCQHEGISYELW